MVTATTAAPTKGFFDDSEDDEGKFRGTVIISEEVNGKFGVQWFTAIFNHNTGRVETNYISPADKANVKAYARSNKKRMYDALAHTGVSTKGAKAGDFVGLTCDFELYEKLNGEGMNPTLLILPAGGLQEPASQAWCAEKAAEFRARAQGGRATPTSTGGGAFVAATRSYGTEQLVTIAQLLNGVNEDDADDVALECTDETLRNGILDGTAIAAAIGIGVLSTDDNGFYVYNA